MEPLTISVKDAARATSWSVPTINRMIKRGELETRKVNGRRLVSVQSLRQITGAA
jgi:excisionase family DNA binding protein